MPPIGHIPRSNAIRQTITSLRPLAIGGLGTTSDGSPQPVSRGIEGLWLMDEGTGVIAADSGGGGNDMTLGAGGFSPLWTSEGLDFQGSAVDSHIYRAWVPDITSGFTIQVVAKRDNVAAVNCGWFSIMTGLMTGDESIGFIIQTAGERLYIETTNSVPATTNIRSEAQAQEFTQYHLYTARWNGTNGEILRDGVSKITGPLNVPDRGGMVNTIIGMGASSRSWDGVIGIAKLNNVYLTDEELAQDQAYLSSVMGRRSSQVPFEVIINVSPGTNTLRDAVNAATPTVSARVKIVMAPGAYNEIQITGKDYLTIEGAGIGSTNIITDGTRTDIDPISGIAYNLMAKEDKHGIFGQKKLLSIRNLTWTSNDVKYCVHCDADGDVEFSADSAKFVHADGIPVGIGLYDGQSASLTDCDFEYTGAGDYHGVFMHNAATQADSCSLIMENCDCVGCGVLALQEEGSGQTDTVTVTNCTTDEAGAGGGIYIEANSAAYSYSLNITQNGGTMPAFAFDAVSRPNAASYYTYNP